MTKCRLKLEITSYIWNKMGDHPRVVEIPEQVRNQLPPEVHSTHGAIINGNQVQVIPPGSRLIECGGNFFAVDHQYYQDYYEEMPDETA
jgi:hypothetical protein